MLNKDTFILFLFCCVLILFFLIGYLLGQNRSSLGVFNVGSTDSKSIKADSNRNISIDDTKYVVEVKTEGLEKKYDQLGEVKQSSENIQNSINKLKQLKG